MYQMKSLTVIIPDGDQVAELKMSSEGAGLARDTLHQTAVTYEAVRAIVKDREAVLFERRCRVRGRNGQSHRASDALSQRSCRHFDSSSVLCLGVTWRQTVYLLWPS